MPDEVDIDVSEIREVNVEKDAVANPKNFTTIPNSNSEFCVYTYKAECESYTQLIRPGFFDSAALFVNAGDTIRVFLYDIKKQLSNYLKFVVLDVDKINRKVTVSIVENCNLLSKVVK